jgi:hypothetical protein
MSLPGTASVIVVYMTTTILNYVILNYVIPQGYIVLCYATQHMVILHYITAQVYIILHDISRIVLSLSSY